MYIYCIIRGSLSLACATNLFPYVFPCLIGVIAHKSTDKAVDWSHLYEKYTLVDPPVDVTAIRKRVSEIEPIHLRFNWFKHAVDSIVSIIPDDVPLTKALGHLQV